MVPKWSQNLSKIDPGGALEATWEPPLKQGASKTSFLTILAPFWDPLWDQFGVILGIIFLMFFWDGFLMALASIWAPKTPPKWDPKGGQNQNLKINDFDCIYYTLATFRGAENDHFSMFLGGLKIDAKMVPKKWSKWFPKGTPKVSQNHQNGFQKPSQNRVPKKHRKIVVFSTLKCGQSV